MIIQADARHLPIESNTVQCVVTSPPYWGLRDYGIAGQLGLERTPDDYVANLVAVFREVRRVLKNDGTLWLNMGDSYTSGGRSTHGTRIGYKQESNAGCLTVSQSRPECPPGQKPKDLVGMPWRVAFALQADGWYLRSDIIWSKPNPMPESVTDRPTKAHSRPGDSVLDPFVGSGTVLRVATRLQRRGLGCDLNLEYLNQQAKKRASLVQVEMYA